jgi:O-acetylhomoserine (thiol)-lyase
VLEERVAALEGGTAALAVASGHAAEFLTMHALMQPGDEFIAATRLYGGSINQFNHSYKNFGWKVVWADSDEPASFEAAITEKTKAIFVESIANPGGVIVDLQAIGDIAKRHNIPFIVDNTMASPYLIRPFEFGADIVVHSATKFLGGHGNSIGGLIVDGGSFNWTGDARYPMLSKPRPEYGGMILGETFGNFAFAIACRVLGLRDLGPALSPFNAFMLLQGIETLPLRMQRHSDNALTVAEHLHGHDGVSWVSYPGLRSDRYHNLAKRYCPKGAGAVFTFGLKGGYDAGVRLVSNLKLFSHLANIGDTRSLVIHPARRRTANSPTNSARWRARGRRWSASRSASRIRRTSSPTSTRRSRPRPKLRVTIRWEEQENRDWHGLSGELIVALVAPPPDGRAKRWFWEVTVHRPHGWRGSGHRTTPLAARRAADDYWARWLEAAALKPDVERLALTSERKPRG